jgi:hypothetical protein
VLGLYICATPPSYPSTTSSSFFFWLGSTGVWTQGLKLARQFSHSTSPCLLTSWEKVWEVDFVVPCLTENYIKHDYWWIICLGVEF